MNLARDNQNPGIVFMGTPSFAVPSLKALIEAGYNIVGVVTAPDKPAGRGRAVQTSPVKDLAALHNLKILQPENLKDESFISSLKILNADLQVVVAFRMLPEIVWSMPGLGTFNLHASLLPQYRGAAPINHAIINGEKKTGVTTFFIDHKIDTGKIISQEIIEISEEDDAGSLHDKLMVKGAALVTRTVELIISGRVQEIPQSELIKPVEVLKSAPKIFKEDCSIDWNKEGSYISNFIRGLSPHPAAYSLLVNDKDEKFVVKIFQAAFLNIEVNESPGTIISDNKHYLKIALKNGYLEISSLQLQGKNRMSVNNFLAGFRNITSFRLV